MRAHLLRLLRNQHFKVYKMLRMPATKSALQGPQSTTLSGYYRKICTSNKYCACNEICTSRSTQRCACQEICTSRSTKRCACHEIRTQGSSAPTPSRYRVLRLQRGCSSRFTSRVFARDFLRVLKQATCPKVSVHYTCHEIRARRRPPPRPQ